MRIRLIFVAGMLCLPTLAHASNANAEADQFIIFLKRFCIDGRLSVEVAERQWKEAGATNAFRGRFVAGNLSDLNTRYDQLRAAAAIRELSGERIETRQEFIAPRLKPDRTIFYGTSRFATPIGKEHYTMSAESPVDGKMFNSCALAGVFSSVSEALTRIEATLSLKGRQSAAYGYFSWSEDGYPTLNFKVLVDDPDIGGPGNILLEVTPQPLTN